jgi:hypothetical protein
VPIAGDREGGVLVPSQVGDDIDRHAVLEEECDVGVAQVVDAEGGVELPGGQRSGEMPPGRLRASLPEPRSRADPLE